MEFSITKKIKDLQNEAESKLKEIEDKKAEFELEKEELEKKKKVLEELEKKNAEDIADARQDIDAKVEQLVVEEKKRYELEDEMHKKALQNERLEELLEEAESAPRPKITPGYGEAIENIFNTTPNFYDITNYNVTNRLEALARQAASRPLTEKEKDFVEIVAYHANNLAKDDYYKDKQGANYLSRQLAQIDFINQLAKKGQENTYNV